MNILSTNPNWRTPYYIKSSGAWPFRRHLVMFEETPVAIQTTDYEVATSVCAAMNGAYNLGMMQNQLENDQKEI